MKLNCCFNAVPVLMLYIILYKKKAINYIYFLTRLVRFLPFGDKLLTGIANTSRQYCKVN